MYGVNEEALQLHAVYKNATSHVRASERAMKLKVRMTKSFITIVPSYTGKKHSFVGIVTCAAHS